MTGWKVTCGLAEGSSILFWAVMASVVQLIVFLVLTRLMPDYRLQIEHNNIAAGMLFGVSALAVGVINAACLS